MSALPGVGSIARPLAESVRISTGRRVHTIQRHDKGWHLWFEDQTSVGPFAQVAVTVPAPEARLLLGRLDELSEPMSRVRMSPCWALMVRIDEPVLPDQDVFSDMSQVIRWVSRNNSKPGRTGRGETIVVHASPHWSRETEDADPEAVAEELWGEVDWLRSACRRSGRRRWWPTCGGTASSINISGRRTCFPASTWLA